METFSITGHYKIYVVKLDTRCNLHACRESGVSASAGLVWDVVSPRSSTSGGSRPGKMSLLTSFLEHL
jgi:hypothetical protein